VLSREKKSNDGDESFGETKGADYGQLSGLMISLEAGPSPHPANFAYKMPILE
jgi:hypothetical protein